jgi:hypothetical protein
VGALTPYRSPPPRTLTTTLKDFSCRMGWHKRRFTGRFRGGQLREAAFELRCCHCGAIGWQFADGRVIWGEVPGLVNVS